MRWFIFLCVMKASNCLNRLLTTFFSHICMRFYSANTGLYFVYATVRLHCSAGLSESLLVSYWKSTNCIYIFRLFEPVNEAFNTFPICKQYRLRQTWAFVHLARAFSDHTYKVWMQMKVEASFRASSHTR